jgi:hypothetical protein
MRNGLPLELIGQRVLEVFKKDFSSSEYLERAGVLGTGDRH